MTGNQRKILATIGMVEVVKSVAPQRLVPTSETYQKWWRENPQVS
jgi:hypothetical protein